MRALEEHQITTAVFPYEVWSRDGAFENGKWSYNGQRFAAVVLPYVTAIPPAASRRLAEFAEAGGRVIITEAWPEQSLDGREGGPILFLDRGPARLGLGHRSGHGPL